MTPFVYWRYLRHFLSLRRKLFFKRFLVQFFTKPCKKLYYKKLHWKILRGRIWDTNEVPFQTGFFRELISVFLGLPNELLSRRNFSVFSSVFFATALSKACSNKVMMHTSDISCRYELREMKITSPHTFRIRKWSIHQFRCLSMIQ